MAPIVAGLAKLAGQLNAVGVQFTTQDLMAGALVIFEVSQDLCPVDTGYLKSTGFVRGAGGRVEIGYEAEYASFLEFGTYKMAAQPFLRPAIDGWEQEALDAIMESVNSHFADVMAGR